MSGRDFAGHRSRWIWLLLGINLLGLIFVFAFTSPALVNATGSCPSLSATVHPQPWPQFHRDAFHTGVVTETAGNISSSKGPNVRWKYRVFDLGASPSITDYNGIRWASSFPLGDLDGDGTLEVVVTSPGGVTPSRIIALKDTPTESAPVRVKWIFTDTVSEPGTGLDMYSPALADADSDGLVDVIATSGDGHLFVIRGCDGELLWDPPYAMDHSIESGPVIADLFGDGKKEIIVTTSATLANGVTCYSSDSNGPNCGALYVFALTDTIGITNHLIFSQTFNYKMDSAVAAVADLDPDDGTNRQVMMIGTWGGVLLGVWRNAGGNWITQTLDLRTLVTPNITLTTPVIRSAPLIWDFGAGQEIVFGWMPDHNAGGEARISAVKVRANMAANTLTFTPTWTLDRQAWKSFPTLLPVTTTMVVDGYGAGVPSNPPNGQGLPTSCGPPLTGGVIALNVIGSDPERILWEKDFAGTEGYRNFVAVADLNGDGHMDVLAANQCFGKLHAFDALSGHEQWSYQLGPYLLASPTLGDLDGDGKLEIIESSYDGYVWALTGGARTYLPLLKR